MIYDIRYGVVSSSHISNDVIVKNPQYGKPIGEWGSRPVCPSKSHYRNMEEKNQFYTRLEKSILAEGFRNPIFCNAYEHGTYCRYGTSRLWMAKKHGLDIPMIVADYCNEWLDLETLLPEEVESKFTDKPAVIEFNDEEMRIDSCPHSHLMEL